MAHFTKTNLCGGPQCQQWQGQNSYNNSYQQAGPSSHYRLAPYQKKFGPKKLNYQNQNPGLQNQSQVSKGPNWAQNQENCQNKKLVKQLLKDKVKTLESNQAPKPDSKGKGKVKVANLATRIGEVSLKERIETNDEFEERIVISKDCYNTRTPRYA